MSAQLGCRSFSSEEIRPCTLKDNYGEDCGE